jgi:hypothetical protein
MLPRMPVETFKLPTREAVAQAGEQFWLDPEAKIVEAALTDIFARYPSNKDELAKMNVRMYSDILRTFIWVCVVLIVLFFIAAITDLYKHSSAVPDPAAPADEGQPWPKWVARLFGKRKDKPETKESYLSSLGFSVVVLL